MTHEEENAVMNGLEKHGWLFEADGCAPSNGPSTVDFWTPADQNGNRHYMKFSSWEEAKKHLESL